LVAAALAYRFPEPPRTADGDAAEEVRSFARTLWSGAVEALRRPALRVVVVAAALLGGIDSVEEYWPLMAGDWGVPAGAVPIATLAIPLAGAVGAALAGRAGRLPAGRPLGARGGGRGRAAGAARRPGGGRGATRPVRPDTPAPRRRWPRAAPP